MESDKLIRPNKYAVRYTISEVMLFMSAAVILFVGLTLLGLTIWSFIWKLVVYRNFMDLKMDTTFLTLPSGLLIIPCFFLTMLLKHNQLKHLIMIFVINTTAITMLFTSYFLGTQYKLHYTNETTHLSHTIPTQPLNYTLYSIIASYEESPENTTALDRLQQTLSCCGSEGTRDFIEIPTSCCNNEDCDTNGYYVRGCRSTIQGNVAWQNNVMVSVIELFILMYFFNIAMVITVYVSDHYGRRSKEIE